MKSLTIIVAIGFAAIAIVLFLTRSGSGGGGPSGWQIQTSSDGYSAWKINSASGVTYFCDARSRACYAIGFKE